MSNSNRSPVFTAGLIALAAFATSGAIVLIDEANKLQRGYENQAQAEAKRHGDRAHIAAERSCTPLPAQAEEDCRREEYNAARQRQHDEYDLQAQLVTSVWTRYMGIAAIIGMAVGIFGVGLIFETFRETRNAATATRETHAAFIAVERARLILRAPVVSFVRVGVGLDILLKCDNMGKSAALITSVNWVHAGSSHWGGRSFECKQLRRSLMSGEVDHITTIDSALNWDKVPWVLGYIEYDSAFSKGHRTHFCYKVECPPPDQFDSAIATGQTFRDSTQPADT